MNNARLSLTATPLDLASDAAPSPGEVVITEFKVEPPALRQLAQLVDRAREDVNAGKKHLSQIQDFAGGEGVINQLTQGHQDAYRALDDWLGKLADVTLTCVSQAVTDAAGYYERTDRGSAEKLDGTYPETSVTEIREHTGYVPIEPPENTGRFQDVSEPQQHLSAVKDYRSELDGSPDWWDTFSPMVQIGNAIEVVSGVAVMMGLLDHRIDPQAEIVKPWVGDWAGIRAAADVLRNVGHEINGVSTNIKWASQGTEAVWHGNAGDGAAVYLMNLAKPLEETWRPIDELAGKYVEASQEMVKLREAVVGVLNAIGDAAIEAAIAAGVAGGSASTGVGVPLAVVAGLFGAYKIYRVVDGIKEIFGIIGKIDTMIKVVQSAQTKYGTIQNGVKLPALPQSTLSAPK